MPTGLGSRLTFSSSHPSVPPQYHRAKEPNSSATNALIAALPPIPIRLVPSSLLHPSVTVPQRQLRLHQQGRRRTESEGIVADRWSSGMWMVLTAVAIVFLAAPQARADEKVVANVPFDFVAGGVRMPAGRYVVTETEYPGVLLVQNSDGRHTA